MTTLVVGASTTTAGIAYGVTADSEFVSFAGDTIVSTSNYAILSTGNNIKFTIGAHVYGRSGGILLWDPAFNGNVYTNTVIDIQKTGILGYTSAIGAAIDLVSSNCDITNAGTITGFGGIFLRGSAGPGTSIIDNSGTILAQTTGVQNNGAQNLLLTNTGTIRSLNVESYLGNSNAQDKVVNKGLMIGDVVLGANNDTYDGRAGRVAANNNGNDVLGEAGNDTLLGGKYVDRFDGGADNDKLTGGLAKDIFTGGTGLDQFIFNSKTECGDTITDFSAADDTIVLKASAFGGLPKGTLSSAAFHASTTGLAHDASDRFIYETDVDKLWYDANGNAAGGRILVADINNVNFTRADILLI